MKTTYSLIFIFLCLISCKDDRVELRQKIYFEKHYVNNAWLPQSSGFLIDSLGNVLEFNWVEVSHIWYDPDSTGNVNSANMDKNISWCQLSTNHIHPDTLKLYIEKIYNASKGLISDPKLVMVDAGSTTYSAFIFDNKTNKYKQVLIKTVGDILITNSTPESEQIYQWLSRIGN
jgi:hypothetical protein